jgi:hypothetical protein
MRAHQRKVGRMRAVILALALVGVAGAVHAAVGPTISGDDVRETLTPTVPAGVRQQAEEAIKADLRDQPVVTFRAVKAVELASLRHGAFTPLIEGPVSVVCGQYSSQDPNGAYAWFFVAIKRGHVLWTTTDAPAGSDEEAHDSCTAVGVAN